ncbi:MAG: hypothetical protein J0I48_19580 [Devosia sp.]|uniref:hypothetical protein n=1 Tax=Devosia sp. 66-22 TaxID=1895753 RepID=UPI000AC7F21D|nr:hypothetical protein [Devosia sp. 66-22]MBN9348370.1 hypothetical protein [Devosia sp.]
METAPKSLRLTPEETLALLRAEAVALLARPGRTVLGIAGGPGSGKSTIAQRLAAEFGAVAAYVPMDGFHMKHAKLEALGTAGDKGMPHTFEGTAFADFLERLRSASGPVSAPGYSRKVEDTVDDAVTISATTRLLIVEGNYLLLATAPWWRVKPLLDRAVYLEVPIDVVRARLMKRHGEEGLFTEERNRAHIERVDLVNHDTVQRSRPRADIAIDLVTDH